MLRTDQAPDEARRKGGHDDETPESLSAEILELLLNLVFVVEVPAQGAPAGVSSSGVWGESRAAAFEVVEGGSGLIHKRMQVHAGRGEEAGTWTHLFTRRPQRCAGDMLRGGWAVLLSRRHPKDGNAHIRFRWIPGSPATRVVAVGAAWPSEGGCETFKTAPTMRGRGWHQRENTR